MRNIVKVSFSIILITILILIFSCCKKTAIVKPKVSEVVPSETQKPYVHIDATISEYGVFCGKKYTIGKTISNDMLFTGNASSIYRNIDKLRDCISIFCGDNIAAGITLEGNVILIGSESNNYDISEWKNIVKVVFGNGFISSLDNDGNVKFVFKKSQNELTTSDSGNLETDNFGVNSSDSIINTSDIEKHNNIKYATDIAAYDNTFAALFYDGTVITKGIECDISNWTDITKIACGKNFILGLKSDGTIMSFNKDDVKTWSDVKDIQAQGNIAACMTNSGQILCTKDYSGLSKIKNAQSFSVGYNFISIVKSNGKISSFGAKNDMQTDTDWWNLMLTINKKTGYITGFAPKTTIAKAKSFISQQFKKEVEFYNNKTILDDNAYVGTGIKIFDNNSNTLGIALIYGDITGDGIIDNLDSKKLLLHCKGKEQLTDIFLNAADTLHYLSSVNTASIADVEMIMDEYSGSKHIKQYIHDPNSKLLIKNYNINNDVVGYIKMQGTDISYPIMYGDNFYYNLLTIYKTRSPIGSIYSFYSEYMKNNVILGHNARKTGRMFNQLHRIQNNKEKLQTYKNRVFEITIYHEYSLWELFAMYETGPNEPISTQINNAKNLNDMNLDQISEWIDGQLKLSELDYKVDVCAEDSLLTLYTCGDKYYSDENSQARLYLFLRRVG